MTEDRYEDDRYAPVSDGTYTTVVRPHQLKRGDVFTEPVSEPLRKDQFRDVVIESVAYGELNYRGFPAPVLFVTGIDTRSQKPVKYTRTAWDFMAVTRKGDAPVYGPRVTTGLATPFVY